MGWCVPGRDGTSTRPRRIWIMKSRCRTFLREVPTVEKYFRLFFVRQVKEYIPSQAERLYWGIEKNLVDTFFKPDYENLFSV